MKKLSLLTIIKRLEEAQGILAEYKPFIRVGDFGSLGETQRIPEKTTGRIHHLLSKLEQAVFLIFDYSPQIIDIREQFPLIPLAHTLEIAHRLYVKHPTYPGDGFPVIMTTDFVLTIVVKGEYKTIAVSVKSKKDFDKPRTREKLNIEKLFWKSKGIKWVLILEDSINWDLVANLKELDRLPPESNLIKQQMNVLETMIIKNSTLSLENIFSLYESKNNFPPGFGYFVFKYLVLNHRLDVDLKKKINLKETFHENQRNLSLC